ncbi:MAG: hypothetical protein KAT85_04840, partial [candidate division Zixibacteria bacterium]|nr:hypothetical protein [candidate division Zixibacteria bacterium]
MRKTLFFADATAIVIAVTFCCVAIVMLPGVTVHGASGNPADAMYPMQESEADGAFFRNLNDGSRFDPAAVCTVIITTTEGGTTSPPPGNYEGECGMWSDVMAIPDEGYDFDHWVLDGENAGSDIYISWVVTQNHLLLAVFVSVSHDIAVTDIAPSDNVVWVDNELDVVVTVENQGLASESSVLTAWCDIVVPNGDFEADPPGTEYDDISDWDYELVVHQGNPPEEDTLRVVDDNHFFGARSLHSFLEIKSVYPNPGDNSVSQYIATEEPVSAQSDYVTLWVSGVD